LILPRARLRQHRDFAAEIFSGQLEESPHFSETGWLYGPLRLSANPASPEFARLIAPVLEPRFFVGRQAFFFVRDPRDILVSSYYSFGWSHVLSPVESIRRVQEDQRRKLQSMTLEEFCLEEVSRLAAHFQTIARLFSEAEVKYFLRYEDMLFDFGRAGAILQEAFHLTPETLEKIERESRPQQTENPGAHRRSGRYGGFAQKLSAPVLDQLDGVLGEVLGRFGYPEHSQTATWEPQRSPHQLAAL
jgi:hypothetical protein